MKFFILGLLILMAQCATAQHCPYDGSMVLLIQLEFEDESLRKHFQMELVVPPYDSSVVGCQDFTLAMDLKKQYAGSIQNTNFVNYLSQKFSEEYGIKPHNYVFFLSHNHLFCYQKGKIIHRDFRLKFKLIDSKSNICEFPIQPEQIYSMCTGAGSWQRIQAIHLKVKKNGEFVRVKN